MDIFKPIQEILTRQSIELFSTDYFMVVIGSFIVIAFFLLWGFFANQPKREKIYKLMIALVVLSELGRQIWLALSGPYEVSWMLPFHLCGLQIFFMPLMSISDSKFMKNLVYFTAIPGGIGAILFNDIPFPITHFLVIQSYFIHALILCIPIYMMFYMKFKPQLKYVFPSALLLVIIALPTYFLNIRWGSNYLYLNDYVANSPMEILYRWVGRPGYIIVFFIILIIVWIMMTLPFHLKERKNNQFVLRRKTD